MVTPSNLFILIDSKNMTKIIMKRTHFNIIMPYDTSNGRALRGLSEYQQLECVLVTWLPWQQISSQNWATILKRQLFSFHGNEL